MAANCNHCAIDMPNLSIRDVPEAIAERLRRRAARNHRSLQGELMAILESAALAEDAALQGPALPHGAPRRTLGDLADDLRRRLGVDVASQSSSTAIVREMRDTRNPGQDR
jgi:hypothetical protein